MSISRSIRSTPKAVRTKVLGFGEEGQDTTDHGSVTYVLAELRTESVEFPETKVGVVRVEKRRVLRHTVFEDVDIAQKLLDAEDERRRAEEAEARVDEARDAGQPPLDDALLDGGEPEAGE